MSVQFKTENSTYEIDYMRYRVRRVSGTNPPTERFAPDGSWKPYDEIKMTIHGALFFVWPDGTGTITSKILTNDAP